MYDCPKCKVPLHGHEEVCPACDAPQPLHLRQQSKLLFPAPKAPGMNMLPFIVVFVAIVILWAISAQGSWIGQLMNPSQRPEDPMAKLTYMDARNIIESKIQEGLASFSAKGRFKWQKQDGSPADKNSPDPVQLTIATRLSNKDDHKAVIDPIKDYMGKANIPTLIMTDSKSGATWTYTVQAPVTTSSDQDTPEQPPAAQ